MLEEIKSAIPVLTAAGYALKFLPTTLRHAKKWLRNWERNSVQKREERLKRLDLYQRDPQMLNAEIHRYKLAASWVFTSAGMLVLSTLLPGQYKTWEIVLTTVELFSLLLMGALLYQRAGVIVIDHSNPNKTKMRLQLELAVLELKKRTKALASHQGVLAPEDISKESLSVPALVKK